MTETAPLYLVDVSGYIFRAYYAVRPLSTSQGVPVNAVVGFARMVLKLLRERKPEFLGLAFDSRAKTFRHKFYTEYKANREAPPEDLVPQFALIDELVDAMGLPVLRVDGYEADDLLATLAARANQRGQKVVIVSGDKDLLQLVDANVAVYDPLKDMTFGPAEVIERFGVPPELVADVQALAGDSSDNVPGVPKVGPKTAAKLVAQYGDIEKVIAALAKAPKLSAAEQSVLDHVESARLSKRLTVLAKDAPLMLDPARLKYAPPDAARMTPFLRKIEASSLLRELGAANSSSAASATRPASAPAGEPSGAPTAASEPAPSSDAIDTVDPVDRSKYRTILTLADLDAVLNAARKDKVLSIDTETTSIDPNLAELVGISLCTPSHPAVYVPLRHHYLGMPRQLELTAVLDRLRPVAGDPSIGKVGQNLKYDYVVLACAGVMLRGIADDSMLAAYVLDPARASYSMDSLAREFLHHENILYKDVAGQGKNQIGFDQVPIETATEYSAEDADVALFLTRRLRERVERAGQLPLYREIELPLLGVLAEMERTGIRIDSARLSALGAEFNARLQEIERRAHKLIGEPINLSSPKQLAELFFHKLGYPVVRKTKTGFSTDQDVLEVLAKDHELPRVILEHRLLSKLKSTYIDTLPRLVNPRTHRLHTSFNQTGTATGRLSSTDPNLQNIPIRSEDGRRIRGAFVTEPGYVLLSADYSQIELRVMAHLSEDPSFIEAFVRGEDIHARTAREIITNGAPADAEARRRAKAINFGILYGLSDYGLSKSLEIPRQQAQAYIAAYFARYPGIRTYLDRTIEAARQDGFVTTLAGRRRFLPDLKSRNHTVRMAAERIAMNTPIQGSAADLIKLAMIAVHKALQERGSRARLLLQVHDELVLECPEGEETAVTELVRKNMSEVLALRVPLTVDIGQGSNWAAAH